jgi:uncharacterized protein YqgV (UPF0045/DUF77 family)
MSGISAQVSIYPLKQDKLSPAIDAVLEAFGKHGIESQMGTMSTMVWGDDEEVFAALLDAFRNAASLGEAVMVMTVSNACPFASLKGRPLPPKSESA